MFLPLEKWLARKTAGPAPKKRLPRVSNRRKLEAPKYKLASAQYLVAHPVCEIGPVFAAAGIYVACKGRATHVHHIRGRGRFLCEAHTFAASCSGECHPQAVHITHVHEARRLGLLIK